MWWFFLLAAATLIAVASVYLATRTSDRAELTRFFEAYKEQVQKKHRDHLLDLPRDERRVRVIGEMMHDDRVFIERFLATDPDLSETADFWMREWLSAASEMELMHQKLIDEGRFTLTEDETARREERLRYISTHVFELGLLTDEPEMPWDKVFWDKLFDGL